MLLLCDWCLCVKHGSGRIPAGTRTGAGVDDLGLGLEPDPKRLGVILRRVGVPSFFSKSQQEKVGEISLQNKIGRMCVCVCVCVRRERERKRERECVCVCVRERERERERGRHLCGCPDPSSPISFRGRHSKGQIPRFACSQLQRKAEARLWASRDEIFGVFIVSHIKTFRLCSVIGERSSVKKTHRLGCVVLLSERLKSTGRKTQKAWFC